MLVGLPLEGLPVTTKIPVASFVVRRVVSTVPQECHIIHVKGVLPSDCQKMPCKRASGKEEVRNLACQWITFLPPDAAKLLINNSTNIVEVSRLLFPRLTGQEPPYEKALCWLQLTYTGYRNGEYISIANTDISFLLPDKGEPLFAPAL